ncbi:MAG: IS4 family transposase [Actinobacteria bacterium]|nr:IS4 family transposase [Actinomycetota bacterium]
MPRAGWVKPETDQRLSDHISLGVLTRVFPPELVDRIVAEAGRTEVRHRLLPARVVVYYVLGLALFSQASYEEVMRNLVEGLAWATGWSRSWNVPTKAALFKARTRLGPEPLAALYDAVAQPLATADTKGAWYRTWRLMALDGTCLDVADTPANAEAFGRPGTGRGSGVGAFPQVRLVGLAECGTHAIVEVAAGASTVSEQALAAEVLRAALAPMLVLADRAFYSFSLWHKAKAQGAELLWRTKSNHRLAVEQRLPDGSYLSKLFATEGARRRGEGVPVRVIEYTLTDPGRPQVEDRYRLLTTLLDPEAAPAAELAALYAQRWEFETALDELKTHQRGARVVLRSKMPDGVIQEVWGYLCVHFAIRWLMHTVALEVDADPDRLSFVRTLRVARRTTASHPGFSPSGAG